MLFFVFCFVFGFDDIVIKTEQYALTLHLV